LNAARKRGAKPINDSKHKKGKQEVAFLKKSSAKNF